MPLTSSFKRDRFFVIKTNNSIEEFFTIENALKCIDKKLIIIDKFKEIFSPSGGFDWRISKFTFTDINNISFDLSDNSWVVNEIDTTYKSSSRLSFEIVISDPLKRIRRIKCDLNEPRKYEDNNSHDIKIIQITLDKLHDHSKFQNWEQVDLDTENKKLKYKIELLQNEINVIKNKSS